MDPTTRLLSLIVAGLASVLATVYVISPGGPAEVGRDNDAAEVMYRLVDEARDEEGLAPLRPADDVADVAAAWSRQMAADGELDHNPAHPEQICCWATVSENVAWSDPPATRLTGDPVTRVVEELHEALLHSPGHRANLLDPGVDEIGIGVHVEPDGSVWITQNFRASAR